MASGDRNYDIATETTQQAILGTLNESVTKIGGVTLAKPNLDVTGKGKLYLKPGFSDTKFVLIVDDVTILNDEAIYSTNCIEIPFQKSISVSQTSSTSSTHTSIAYVLY